jgi:hypothetical protein
MARETEFGTGMTARQIALGRCAITIVWGIIVSLGVRDRRGGGKPLLCCRDAWLRMMRGAWRAR